MYHVLQNKPVITELFDTLLTIFSFFWSNKQLCFSIKLLFHAFPFSTSFRSIMTNLLGLFDKGNLITGLEKGFLNFKQNSQLSKQSTTIFKNPLSSETLSFNRLNWSNHLFCISKHLANPRTLKPIKGIVVLWLSYFVSPLGHKNLATWNGQQLISNRLR